MPQLSIYYYVLQVSMYFYEQAFSFIKEEYESGKVNISLAYIIDTNRLCVKWRLNTVVKVFHISEVSNTVTNSNRI